MHRESGLTGQVSFTAAAISGQFSLRLNTLSDAGVCGVT